MRHLTLILALVAAVPLRAAPISQADRHVKASPGYPKN
jgi:hypothetical protein